MTEQHPPLLDDLHSQRLYLRAPRHNDVPMLLAAVETSFAELHPWMEFAVTMPTAEISHDFIVNSAQQRAAGETYNFFCFLRDSQTFIGACGMHHIDWSVPAVEIGYWLHTAHYHQGYATEIAETLTTAAFTHFGAMRVEIRCDARNVNSRRVAERAGFQLEGILRQQARDNDGNLRDTCVFARLCGE